METDRVYRRYRTVLVENSEEAAKRLSAAAEQAGHRGPLRSRRAHGSRDALYGRNGIGTVGLSR